MNLEFQATSEIYWWSASIVALLDFAAAWILIPRVPLALFHKLRTEIIVVSALFWGVLWGIVMSSDFVWATCYQFVFSNFARWYWPPIIAILYGGIGWFFWWLAIKISNQPVLNFLLLGGLVSLPGHLWAMLGRGLMETPLLENVSKESALMFGIFEFIFYWSFILSAATLIYKARLFFINRNLLHENLLISDKRL